VCTFLQLLLFPLSWVQIFCSAPSSQPPAVHVLPLRWEIISHTTGEITVLCTLVVILLGMRWQKVVSISIIQPARIFLFGFPCDCSEQ
jgi:hypothetical protein